MANCCVDGCKKEATVHVVIGDPGGAVVDADYWGMSYCSIAHLTDDRESMEANAPSLALGRTSEGAQ